MIGVDFDCVCRLVQVMSPVPACFNQCKEFSIVDIVIPLRLVHGFQEEGDQVRDIIVIPLY